MHVAVQDAEGGWGGTTRITDGAMEPLSLSTPAAKAPLRPGEGITGCCSILSSILRMQRSLTEVWSDLSDDTKSEGYHSQAQETYQSLVAKEDDETNDNRAAYQRFFVSVVDSTDKLDRLLAAIDTPTRSDDQPNRARQSSDAEHDVYDCGTTNNTVQFNTKEEAEERAELTTTLRQLGGGLASDTGVVDLRAVAFWSLAKRERLWAEDEKLTRAEQTSLRSIRAMQVNHEEVDTVLSGRRKRIEDNMVHMQRGLEAHSEGWSEILMGVKDGVVRSRLQAQKRTRDILSATEERIAALKVQLEESEDHVVGLNDESEEFVRAKNAYERKAGLLQHIVEQQRARLEQISSDLQRTTKEAGSLDDSLRTITKLESAAEGSGKDAVPSKEQNEGKEKLQALVREESRRKNEEQSQAIAKRAGLLEENKRLRAEVEKAETCLSQLQTPEEARMSSLRLHQSEVNDLQGQVESASAKLLQTERQLTRLSRKPRRSASQRAPAPPPTTKLDQQPQTIPTPRDHPEEGPALGREQSQVDPQAWYQLEILRAQHGVLVEDLQRSDDDDAAEGAGDKGLRERTRLTAACWQLRDNGEPQEAAAEGGGRKDGEAALELAAVSVAADLTSTSSSGLTQKIHDTLEWEGQARPLEDELVANASRVRWMYVLRLALEIGQCDQGRWEELQRRLVNPPRPVDLKGLYSTREDVLALFRGSSGDPVDGGVFSTPTVLRGRLTRLIEGGQARVAKLNALLRALWDESKGSKRGDSSDLAGAVNDLIGVVIGESQLQPELALRLFSALGSAVVRQAKTGAEGVSSALALDAASLRLTSKGVANEETQRAAVAVTELCAVLKITQALAKGSKQSVPAELARRGAALQDELRARIKNYSQPDGRRHAADVLGDVEDFIAELPPEMSEHGPGNGRLDLMVLFLGVVTSGKCQGPDDLFNPGGTAEVLRGEVSTVPPSGENIPAQGSVSGVARKGPTDAEKDPHVSATDRSAGDQGGRSGHQLDEKETLTEIYSKIARALPCGPDQSLTNIWGAVQARLERPRPRDNEEVEMEAFELAVDAQALEALKQSLHEAVEASTRIGLSPALSDPPSTSAYQAPAPVATGLTELAASSGIRLGGYAPPRGLEVHSGYSRPTQPAINGGVNLGDETKTLQRQAEVLQYKNRMNIAARTGLPLQNPDQAGNAPSLGAVVAAKRMEKRWKWAALNDGTGLDRQELERLNSLMDSRIENLSAQLAELKKENNKNAKIKAGVMTTRVAAEEVDLSEERWSVREVQRLNARLRFHREKLQGAEIALRDVRKGKISTGEMETLWMSPAEREEMEANLRLISRKIAKANFLLRTMRSRWDVFREKHRHLAHDVQDRLVHGYHAPRQSGEGAEGALSPRGRERMPPSLVLIGATKSGG